MKKHLKLLFILGMFSFFAVSSLPAKEAQEAKTDYARDFKLQDLNQDTFILSSYRDKQPVILFFWTTWCPFCRKELSTLKRIYPQLLDEGWELFAIDVGEPAYKVSNFVKSYDLNFKVLLDKDSSITYAYEVLGVPTYVLIDKKGYIVFKDNYFPQKEYKDLASQ